MGNKRNFSAKYRFLLNLCRLFKLQRVMELPPEKAKKMFAKAYKGVQIPKLDDEEISTNTESVMGSNCLWYRHINRCDRVCIYLYGVHVTMEVAPGMYHCYAVMPFVKDAMPDLAESLRYTVELTDAAGNKVTVDEPVIVYHSLAIQFGKQDAIFGTYEYKHQLQQVSVEPSMFVSSGFDFTKVVSVKISTDGSEEGEIMINNIGYWK